MCTHHLDSQGTTGGNDFEHHSAARRTGRASMNVEKGCAPSKDDKGRGLGT
jgi:hypothetical protein